MKFVKPSIRHEKLIAEFRKELINSKSSFDGTSDLGSYEDVKKYLEDMKIYESEETYPRDFCKIIQYFYMDDEEKEIIGMIQKRDHLSRRPYRLLNCPK